MMVTFTQSNMNVRTRQTSFLSSSTCLSASNEILASFSSVRSRRYGSQVIRYPLRVSMQAVFKSQPFAFSCARNAGNSQYFQ